MVGEEVIFTVHYGGRFNRKHACTYVGGKIGVYDDTYDLDYLSFIKIETIVKKFGYQPGDLIYYLQPSKSLDDGLVLLTCDADVLRMTKVITGTPVVVLYIVAFGHGDEEEEDEVNDVDERKWNKIINDPFWKSLMGNDNDAWDDGAELGVGTSTRGNVHGDDEGDGEDEGDDEDGGDDEGDDEGNGEDECVNDDDEGNVEDECVNDDDEGNGDDEDSDDVDYNEEDGDGDEDMEESDQPEVMSY
jgi:hypothetical protein